MASATVSILEAFGLDCEDESLRDTPERVGWKWVEMLSGYKEDPKLILDRTFPHEKGDEMIVLSDIEFHSVCEHHLLPFTGTATVGYIPGNGRVVGVSKLARLVDCFAKRLQIQERMTHQVCDAINEHLEPKGVGVIVKAQHLCMVCRGVRKSESVMTTSALRGNFLSSPVRAEFMGLR